MKGIDRLRKTQINKSPEVEDLKTEPNKERQKTKLQFSGAKKVPKSIVLEADESINRMLEEMKFKGRKTEFVKQFVLDFNPEKAAARAGYGSAKHGFKLIKEESVLNAIKAVLDAHEANALITPEFLQGQMGIYARSNMADYFDRDGAFKGFDQISRAEASCISGFHKKYDKEGRPEYKIQLYDAMKANELMSKVHQLYEKPVEDPHEFDDMTQDELIEWLSENLSPDIASRFAGGS